MTAFERSFSRGYGTETDVRDLDGQLVISHDMPRARDKLGIEPVLALASHYKVPLALNIKSDGLAKPLRNTLDKFPGLQWFVFDMSVPDMRNHLALGNTTYTRFSEIEQQPAYLERAAGIWLDALDTPWLDSSAILRALSLGKPVCLVSPELHQRDPLPLWTELRSLAHATQLTLCTDLPDQAKQHIMGAAQ
ncbi:PI-PLC domain-containing protein [Aquabacterium parvum]|uniref:hypothetical protein n=1 Tax=Aquabacterium parvum TaxID=70584 RepID=UPI001910DBB4|nr:hypothetical protein [Aquabacterium parvum]